MLEALSRMGSRQERGVLLFYLAIASSLLIAAQNYLLNRNEQELETMTTQLSRFRGCRLGPYPAASSFKNGLIEGIVSQRLPIVQGVALGI